MRTYYAPRFPRALRQFERRKGTAQRACGGRVLGPSSARDGPQAIARVEGRRAGRTG